MQRTSLPGEVHRVFSRTSTTTCSLYKLGSPVPWSDLMDHHNIIINKTNQWLLWRNVDVFKWPHGGGVKVLKLLLQDRNSYLPNLPGQT
eukprot:1212553-Rhodomonas_salina.1